MPRYRCQCMSMECDTSGHDSYSMERNRCANTATESFKDSRGETIRACKECLDNETAEREVEP